jgi:DNA-binding MarR family transcriptional regulator
LDRLGTSLIDLIGFLNSPQRDDALLREAGVGLDRALLALLVALDARGPLSVAELAGLVGRDHTTVSRQLAKAENIGLIERCQNPTDGRSRTAQVTDDGTQAAGAITAARRRLLSKALAGWSEADRKTLADMTRRFADSLMSFAHERP